MKDRIHDMPPAPAGTFDDFWLAYLRAHRRRTTRVVHYTAAASGAFGLLVALMSARVWVALPFLIFCYALGASGHLLFEKNRVIVRHRPIWSLACCYRMAFSALTGHLDEDLRRAAHRS